MPEHQIGRRLWWLPGSLVLGCVIVSYWSTIDALVRQWLASEDYSHGLLIVPIAGYLIWQKRSRLAAVEVKPDWRALPVFLFSIAVYIVGELGAELFTIRVSMILFIIVAVWFLYGSKVLRILCFPLAFLFLMLPLPGFIFRNVTFPLQLSASIGSVNILQALGISVYREGNVIDMGFMQLQVVEACSGLRYILPLLTLGVLFAYFGQRLLWKRIVLIIATIPIAIAANVLRVAGTGFIGIYWGNKAAEGFFHSFSGWAVFMVCIGFFFLLNLILKYIPGDQSGKKGPDGTTFGPVSLYRASWYAVVVAIMLILATPALVNSLSRVPPVPLKQPLSAFPEKFDGWVGEKTAMDPDIWERVGAQDYIMMNYSQPDKMPINFYVAYYEYQRKAGDFVHSPKLCLPGAGWFIEKNHVRQLKGAASNPGTILTFNELVIQKNNVRQLVYFWYQGRDRNFTNEFAAKFYMVWDGVWRRRTDGALVRLILPLGEKEGLDNARRLLDAFALGMSAKLEDYLP